MTDWLAAFDDGLCQRLDHCTLCGRAPIHTWGILGWQTVGVSYVLCRACGQPDGMRRVERLVAQRYHAGLLGSRGGTS